MRLFRSSTYPPCSARRGKTRSIQAESVGTIFSTTSIFPFLVRYLLLSRSRWRLNQGLYRTSDFRGPLQQEDVELAAVLACRNISHICAGANSCRYYCCVGRAQVTPDGANSLLDGGRLAWLTSECCRLTGATSMIASREEYVLKHRKSKSKVRTR